MHTRVQTRHVDTSRGTAQQRGYTYAWSQYSAQFRQAHPICGERADGSMDTIHSRCVQQGKTTPAECVDHTVPLTKGGAMWDAANHMSACLACNTWKAQTLEQKMAIGGPIPTVQAVQTISGQHRA